MQASSTLLQRDPSGASRQLGEKSKFASSRLTRIAGGARPRESSGGKQFSGSVPTCEFNSISIIVSCKRTLYAFKISLKNFNK